jgi:hypothetical protein
MVFKWMTQRGILIWYVSSISILILLVLESRIAEEILTLNPEGGNIGYEKKY